MSRKALVRLRERDSCQSRSEVASTALKGSALFNWAMPALFTRMSTRPHSGFGPVQQALHLGFVGQVGARGAHVVTACAQFLRSLPNPLAAGGDQQAHAFAGQSPGNGETDTEFAAGAADERDLACPLRKIVHFCDHKIDMENRLSVLSNTVLTFL